MTSHTFLAQSQSKTEIEKSLDSYFYNLRHRLDVLEKKIDDVLWFERVGDIAHVDKVFLAGAPPRGHENAKTLQEQNPVKFWSYVFIPKDIDPGKKYPLIVLPHGGVHGDFNTYYTHIIREMMAQQYIVVAPEYRGSTGYGRLTYELIDYGGLENDDVDISRQFMIDNYSIVDKDRVGIVGWSHGGMIALMNIFENPRNYKCAFAGVPVSDLVSRMGYKRPSYEDFFSASYHIGDQVHENIDEYRRRSPVYHAHKLNTPLLIHANTNDEDVHVLEVENLINRLKALNKTFEYEIFQDIPGGHSFDRMDHRQGREIRFGIYKFLEKHLNPPVKFRNLREMEKAAYRYY
ncbi:MAG: S9 family peptidase [Bacteroidetes bacterium]|nr:MAG: S9 family peptidase [Bacteroidota bacterium]